MHSMSDFVYKDIYINILRTSSGFYDNNSRFETMFEYELNYDNLNDLKAMYDFTILQDEDEIQTFINAVNWTTKVLFCKNETNFTDIKEDENSANIIRSVNSNKYVANCYAHAVVLDDVFRILGYQSRYVFCAPIDYHFSDNHVVNLVFSKIQQRWLLFDAAQNLYYTDKHNNIIDLQTLRRYLIEEKDINISLLPVLWDNLNDREKKLYCEKNLIYMSKNVYRFYCYHNCQTDRLAKGKKVIIHHLVPNTYMTTPYVHKFFNSKNKVMYEHRYLSNPDIFWEMPHEELNVQI